MHSHFLPGVDDGCKTPEESCKVLQLCAEQGVGYMAATPHYYADEPLGRFLERRNAAMQLLTEHMGDMPRPEICLGAEVAYYPGLEHEDRIADLCLGKSNYLLLEMPFSRWTPSVLRHVRALVHVQGIVPVFAHVERYLHMQDKRTLDEFLDIGGLVQMNGSFLLERRTRHKAVRMLRKGLVDVMGSDCHNLTSRAPNMGDVWDVLYSAGLGRAAENISETMQEIFEEAMSR